MRLPYVKSVSNKQLQQIVAFGGVRYGRGGNDGEFSETENLSARQYPTLSQRGGRRSGDKEYTSPTAFYARGKLMVVDGTDLYYGEDVVGQVVPGGKRFATINTKVVIFPDKVYFDTSEEEKKLTPMEVYVQIPKDSVTWTDSTLERKDGGKYSAKENGLGDQTIAGTEKVNVYTGYTIDQSNGTLTLTGEEEKSATEIKAGDILKDDSNAAQFFYVVTAEPSGENVVIWSKIFLVKEEADVPFTDIFSINQAVEISGSSIEGNNKTIVIRAVEENKLTFYADSFSTGTEENTVVIRRKVPDLKVICESENRVWGADTNTIWASALGDPAAWYTYDGVATDSFSVVVGTDGPFTACIAYGSNVLFFKEDHLHKILGSYPAEYRMYTYSIPGVQEGSQNSLAIVNEVLYYKGTSGVYTYTGATPVLMSENFGLRRFKNARAGANEDSYYISMQDEVTGDWTMMVYNTIRGLWLREDATHAVGFAWLDGDLYLLDADRKKTLLLNQDDDQEGRFPWLAEFVPFDDTTYGKKGYSRLYIRMELDPGAWVKAEQSEDAGPWHQINIWTAETKRTVVAGIVPGRCDRYRLRLSGLGRCVIQQIVREFDIGGDR